MRKAIFNYKLYKDNGITYITGSTSGLTHTFTNLVGGINYKYTITDLKDRIYTNSGSTYYLESGLPINITKEITSATNETNNNGSIKLTVNTILENQNTSWNYHFILKDKDNELIDQYHSKTNNSHIFSSLSGNTNYYVDVEDSRGENVGLKYTYIDSTTPLNVTLTPQIPTYNANDLCKIIVNIKYAKFPCTLVLKNETLNLVNRSIITNDEVYVFELLTGGYEYSVTTTDARQYTSKKSVFVNSTIPINLSLSSVAPTVETNNNGKIIIDIANAAYPYTITLINHDTSQLLLTISGITTSSYTINNISGDTNYEITAFDSVGKSDIKNIYVNPPTLSLNVVVNKMSLTTIGGSDASVTLTVTGGRPNYNYVFYNNIKTITSGNTTSIFNVTGLTEGVYHVSLSDSIPEPNTTLKNMDVYVDAYHELSLITGYTEPTTIDNNDGTINITVNYGNTNYDYKIYNLKDLNIIIQSGNTYSNYQVFNNLIGGESYKIMVDTNGKTGNTLCFLPSSIINIDYYTTQEITIDGDATLYKNLLILFTYNIYETDINNNIYVVKHNISNATNIEPYSYFYIGYNNSADETKIIQINTFSENFLKSKTFKFKIYDTVFNFYERSYLSVFNNDINAWRITDILTPSICDLTEYNINSITLDNTDDKLVLNNDVVNNKILVGNKYPMYGATINFSSCNLVYTYVNGVKRLFLETVVSVQSLNENIIFNDNCISDFIVEGIIVTYNDGINFETTNIKVFSNPTDSFHKIISFSDNVLTTTYYNMISPSSTIRSFNLMSTPYIISGDNAVNIRMGMEDDNYIHVSIKHDLNSGTSETSTDLNYDSGLNDYLTIINYKTNFNYNKNSERNILFTKPVKLVTSTSAFIGGYTFVPTNIIKTYGVCYSTSINPTTGSTNIIVGTDKYTFNFDIELDGLIEGQTYYARVYTIDYNNYVSYGDNVMFNTFYNINLTTENVTEITTSGATSGYNIIESGNLAITEKGICYSLSIPTVNDTKITSDSILINELINIPNLIPNTHYYVRSYAINSNGVSYGDLKEFTTHPNVDVNLTITQEIKFSGDLTNYIDKLTGYTYDVYWHNANWNLLTIPPNASLINSINNINNINYDYIFDGENTIITQSNTFKVSVDTMFDNYNYFMLYNNVFKYKLDSTLNTLILPYSGHFALNNPTLTDTDVVLYNSDYNSSSLLNKVNNIYLTSTHYKITCIYSLYTEPLMKTMLNNNLYTYSYNNINVNTDNCTDISLTTATSGGNVIYNDGNQILTRGVCWSTSSNPSLSNYYTIDGSGSGYFSSNLTNLNSNTTYYVRAYASNSLETIYGVEVSFTTYGHIRILTNNMSDIAITTATCKGYINDNGGVQLISRGVCYSLSSNPTLNDNHTIDGNTIGTLISNITGLTHDTTYFLKTYATNQFETVYGDEIIFETVGSVEIKIDKLTKISNTNVICQSSIVNTGKQEIFLRGVCWSKSHNPIIYKNNNVTSDGTSLETIESTINNLSYGDTYYVRAYTISINNLIDYSDEVTYVNV